MHYLRNQSRRETPQSEAMRPDQSENNAGGFGWEVDDFTKLRRFLILGAEGGTYYVGERQLVKGNTEALERCLAADGPRTVALLREVSKGGLARDNDAALFALAAATAADDLVTRRIAWDALPDIARTGTHLLHFVGFREQFGGWGRAAKRGVAAWYEEKEPSKLAYQLVKYRQRDGWSHEDVLRLVHPTAATPVHQALHSFITGRPSRGTEVWDDGQLRLIEGFRKAQDAATPADSARLALEYGLPREALKSDHLPDVGVQAALLENMPMTALIRNLANMTRSGLLSPFSEATQKVIAQIGDSERLRKARVHPLTVITAMLTYKSGKGDRGGNTWDPVAQIVDALNDAFYASFEFVEPTGKRHMLAIDVSNSMWSTGGRFALAGMTAAEGAAVMAMVTARTESMYETMAFAGGQCPRGIGHSLGVSDPGGGWGGREERGFTPMAVTPSMRLDAVIAEYQALAHVGRTDCALPMLYALEAEREVDVFVVYTDNETWSGTIHPMQALRKYREKSGIDAKLIVAAMTSTEFTIADPKDAGALDVVGFDTRAPAMMSAFARGEV